MADRHTSASSRTARSGVVGAARNRAVSSSTTHGVRRNLFQKHQLARSRHPAASPVPDDNDDQDDGGDGIRDALHLDADAQHEQRLHGSPFQAPLRARDPADDIVVRDDNGEVELGDPPTPPLDDDEETAAAQDARYEHERERQRLAEAVKQHQIGQDSVPMRPEELLEAVKASLRAKIAALDDDNWLYEPDERPQQHR